MYKLLPSYIIWGIISLSIVAVLLQFFYLNYVIIDNGLRLMVLLAALLFKRRYAIFTLGASIFLIFFSIENRSHHHEQNYFAITFTYSCLSLTLALLLGFFIKRAVQNVKTEKAQMTALFENATEGILLVNASGEIVLVNAASAQMFGYTPNELTGEKIELLVPKEYRSGHVAKRDAFMKSPQDRKLGRGRDLKAVRKDGSQFPVEISLSSFKDEREVFVIAFIIDITHRKEFENRIIQQSAELEKKVENRTLVLKEALNKLEESQKELQESLEKQKELNDLKSKFVSMASHEFRTPLSTVLSSAELISKYKEGIEQQKRDKHIERIKSSVHHLNDILEDFLSVGKLEEGRVKATNAMFNLYQLLEDVKTEMEENKKHDQEFYLQYNGDTDVMLDKKLLYHILINLLTNSVKYSESGKAILINADRGDAEVSITVKDEGIGIPDADQGHLFNTFFRGTNAANIPGTGLGLHIVKRYVDLMGGSISLKSKLNCGTAVTIKFPLNNQPLKHEQEYSYNRG
jgi:PAS domain S-box-containing protein